MFCISNSTSRITEIAERKNGTKGRERKEGMEDKIQIKYITCTDISKHHTKIDVFRSDGINVMLFKYSINEIRGTVQSSRGYLHSNKPYFV